MKAPAMNKEHAMSKGRLADGRQRAIDAEAARWLTRLQGSALSLDEMARWQQWMARDPAHSRAFKRMEEVWHGFEALESADLPSHDAVVRDTYDGTVAVSEWVQRRQTASRSNHSRWFAVAACFAVVAIVSTWATVRQNGTEIIETRVGENRTVMLSDGSKISLGGRSRLEVAFRPEHRELTLSSGEALFSVAKDPRRPFLVRAGTATVTAVGTQFNVRRGSDRVIVSVIEGRVLVQPTAPIVLLPWLGNLERFAPIKTNGSSEPLEAGQRTVVNRSGFGETVQLPDVSVDTRWRNGQLSFEDEPLRNVIEDVNRYARKPIVIDDVDTAQLRISGTLLSEHIDGWIASLATAFGIEASEDEHEIRLRREPGRND